MRLRGLQLAAAAAVLCTTVTAQGPQPASAQGQTPGLGPRPAVVDPAVKVFIYAGLKTHGPGQHDYPQFLADWSKILTERGAAVTGGLQFPSERELANADVLVIYKGDAGYMSDEERQALEAYIRRGGGIVTLHDALCGPDPAQYAAIVGGGKKHGEVNYTLEAEVPYTIVDASHPIMQGMTNFAIKDEAFFNMTWAKGPEIKVLATATIAATRSAKGHEGEVVPQVWAYERTAGSTPYRAFVWMQGHNYENFSLPAVQGMLLRGIAWAGKKPADALSSVRPPRGRGGRGRGTTDASPQAPGRGGL